MCVQINSCIFFILFYIQLKDNKQLINFFTDQIDHSPSKFTK